MSNSVGDIPQEVMKGFAEYGANFFALYDFTGAKLNAKPLFCISEKPFGMKMAAEWKESAKASLAKKLIGIEGKAAELCQIINQRDYSVVNAGDTTYDRYNGMKNLTYETQVTVLSTPYPSVDATAKLSTASEVESFLSTNALPRVSDKITGELVKNFAQVAVDTPQKIVDAMSIIKDTSADTADAKSNWAKLGTMISTAKKLRELTNQYKNKYNSAIQNTVAEYIIEKLSDGAKVSTTVGSNIDFNKDNTKMEVMRRFNIGISGDDSDDSYYLNLTIDNDVCNQEYNIIGITDLYDTLIDLQIEANSEGYSFDQITEFYKNRWSKEVKVNSPGIDNAVPWVRLLKFFEITINDQPQDILPTDKCKRITDLNAEYEAACKVIIDEANVAIAKDSKDAQKEKDSRNKLEKLADSFITFQRPFGEFNQRITPLILYYTFAGMIFADHVVVTSWTESPDLWGFNTKFSINMEKAEIESFADFYHSRVFKPDC